MSREKRTDSAERLTALGRQLGEAAFRRAGGYLAEMQDWGLEPSRPSHRQEFMILDLYAIRAGMSKRTSTDRVDLVLDAAARECAARFAQMTDQPADEFQNTLEERHRQYDALCVPPETLEDCVREAVGVFAMGVGVFAKAGRPHEDSPRNWLSGVAALLVSNGVFLGQRVQSGE